MCILIDGGASGLSWLLVLLRQVLFVWSCVYYSSKFYKSAQRYALQFWTRTSAVGLHGLSPTRASVPQAGGHILARLALCRLGRLWLCLRTQEAQGKGVNTFADMYIIRNDHLVIHPSVTSSAVQPIILMHPIYGLQFAVCLPNILQGEAHPRDCAELHPL